MKARHGFVSNSSSSSFIIAVKGNKCPHCGNGSPFLGLLESLVGRHSDYSEVSCAKTSEQVIAKLSGDIAECEEELAEGAEWEDVTKEELSTYWKELAAIREMEQDGGWKVYELRISYSDSWLNCLLEAEQTLDQVKIIERW
jgi:hypothetical protein